MRRSARAANRRHRLPAGIAAFFTTLLALPVQAAVALPEVPLQTSATVAPNIVFIIDDSGSMQGEILPDESIDRVTRNPSGGAISATVIGRVYPRIAALYGSTWEGNAVGEYANIVADPANVYGRLVRTARFNPQYYNPSVTYRPWAKADGSSFPNASITCAYWNPMDTGKGCVDLTQTQTYGNVQWQRTDPNYCPTSACVRETASSSNTRSFEFDIYYTFSGNPGSAADRYDASKYTKVKVPEAQRQNFANWFQYHRSRILASRGGVGRAFSTLPNAVAGSPRVGYASINSSGTLVSPVRPFAGDDRAAFYTRLYGDTIPALGTPLRKSLYDIGKYFENETGVNDPWRTAVGDAEHSKHNERLACRQSFAMLMTDGYWNGRLSAAAATEVGNADGLAGYPFADDHSGSDIDADGNAYTGSTTLADVAYHFWKRDLRPGIADQVPATTLNPNTHQHMVTYGIGLGVHGSIDPQTAFAEIGKTSGSLSWPNPFSGSSGYTQGNKIDDLLHAAINSRGGFFSAGDPESFASELSKTLAAIVERTASGSNVSANSVSLGTDTKVFQASYVSGQWTGELAAYPVTANGLGNAPQWRASGKIPVAAERKLYTWNGSSGVALNWSNLTAAQKTGLNNDSSILDYLRGVRSGERQNGGNFRNRAHLLGDIVYSSPAYASDSDTVFVGANDGFLHAFDAKTGVERFAYMPAGLDWAKLRNLASPSYTHHFFVDGPLAVSDKGITPNKNILVGSLGRGGKGLYALDVTAPGSFAGTDVKWEYGAGDADMGLVLSRPILAKLNNGKSAAIVANGPNSGNEDAALFVIDLGNGTLIAKLKTGTAGDNGLSAPRGWDADGNGTIDYVYAGDLKGNLWKFDLTDDCNNNCGSKWKIANSGNPLFQAKDANGKVQPISGGLSLAMDPASYRLWVFFGTGRFLTTADPSDLSVQSWYGLIDEGSAITGRDRLKERKIVVAGEVDVKDSTGTVVGKRKVRAFEKAQPGDLVGKQGWFVDLTMPGTTDSDPRVQEGERMVGQPNVIGRVLLASSIIPSTDTCVGGGRGYLNAIDPFSGGRTGSTFFDANNDGRFNDTVRDGDADAPIGSVDLDVAMPTDPALVDDRAVVGGSDGRRRDVKTDNPAQVGRLSWRELIRD